MQSYKNILAVINRETNYRKTFLKSMHLSKISGAKLTLLDIHHDKGLFSKSSIKPATTLKHHSSYHSNYHSSSKSENLELDELETILKQNNVNFEIQQQSAKQDYKNILHTLNQKEFDLVVKDKPVKHYTHFGLKPSDDWHLLRESPVPVMLVTQSNWKASGHILSAIETESQEAQHMKINQNILDHTYCLSHLLDSNVHLMNCYLGESLSMAIESTPEINQKLLHLKHLAHLSETSQQSTATLHVCEGLPEYGISDLANEYHVNIVVLGTSEHANFINNVTGHTSEYIIDKLDCDVLTIKPLTNLYH